ncbi:MULTISPECIES: CDP-alcohol phosphatidyltransferase family protein [unclassified Rhizobium]|uniref:CDP-alcohol phosphatidyltransferase family protein n=1 Tax=unclassified Rhizobium TaxID=2613769 RepID=UPI001C83926F|nr:MULTISPECIES: CDP-alcohol phosphatidyltransferase family protein [unclassified Rhizobium]MBX5159190.1 CDP-alcohol phosphatidyltransferase family protein [Rhizobium sp. NZLR8]MBX5162181.1 CDP-alcohol phosphatidyltransferase family protein [Rhizobium sp. NZLR4b]MBX5170946.1 CDP-alcohol phosphatidyltransferase family protein [Rhizobium sp. NZLR1b]MBX5199287.1 CDP-alcohol phosphatidyltransferase family protein [Rhizobium sp. NZLR10]MBX5206402.1 CDP-alcohol phosphatidyltransferase family protein
MGQEEDASRRPIASRSSSWAIGMSARLARTGVTPNRISLLSILFAGIGAALILLTAHPIAMICAAISVQLRLVCNLLDGMVAIEGGKKTKSGPIYNEFPDRIADSLLLVAAGYACAFAWLGWLGALLAAFTAYIRVFGGAVGLPQDFSGIMAKQRRMAVLTAGLVAQSIETLISASHWSLILASAIIAAGSLVTCITRTKTLARSLERL